MAKFPEKLVEKMEVREAKNNLRVLPVRNDLVDFSSNDYLGFARDVGLRDRVDSFLGNNPFFKNGATGSRLLSGNHPLYQQLERFLAEHHGYEDAVVFNSGYDANIGLFSSVPQRGDVVLYDELVHASIRDGIRMGNAKAYKYGHNNLQDLEKRVDRIRHHLENSEIYVVTESVFSMDGDSPDIQELIEFCNRHSLHLIVDEAHAIGVFGKGLVPKIGGQHLVFASVITFGKALGCHGAAILGSTSLKNYLINFSNSLIYTTGLPPHTVATILMSYEHLQSPEGIKTQKRLLTNIDYFNSRIEQLKLRDMFLRSESAIQIVLMSGADHVKRCAQNLRTKGYDAKPILSPTVPEGKERLRLCLHAYNLHSEIDQLLYLLSNAKDG